MADDPTPHLERFGSYERACREFRWRIPDGFNIANAILSRHPDAVTRVALVEARPGGLNTYTYGGLDYLSDKFAMALDERGVRPRDSVAVILPQSAAAIVAHLGALKLGASLIPLSVTLEVSALAFALKDSRPRAVVIDHTLRERLRSIGASVETVFVVKKLNPEFKDISPDVDFWREVFEASADFTLAETAGDSPAFIFYHTASEGRLVRTTHNHASLIYQLPALELCNNFQVGEDTAFWTPQEWVSIDSLLCSVYPALWYGCRIVAFDSLATGSDAWNIIERCGVTNFFGNREKVSWLRQATPASISSGEFKLRNIVCTGAVPADGHDWANESLGASISTIYCNPLTGSVASSCGSWFETRKGSSGRATPGYSIQIVDEQGRILPPGSEGRLAIRRTDQRPSNEPPPTQPSSASDFAEEWTISGDIGFKDEDGYLWLSQFSAR
jgi:acetyl-CoA synthetase